MLPSGSLFEAAKKSKYKIAVIDLMILKRQKLSALQ
ncbi:MAG: sugar phosphate isomerase/epimerase, partial [Pedobacter sp.]